MKTRSANIVTRPLAALLAAAALASSAAGIAQGSGQTGLHALGAAASRSAQPPVPTVLAATESSAEDLVDYALQAQRGKLVAGAKELQAAAGSAGVALRKAGASPAAVTLLQKRAARVAALAPKASFIRVALAANAVSQLMPGFYARFSDPVPPTVLALDYLDREAQLRSIAGEQEAVRAAVVRLGSTWKTLRPRVTGAGGASVASRYDAHVAAMTRLAQSGDAASLQREAVRGLDLVDLLEGVFVK